MKARIKKTGEILRVADYTLIAMENCNSRGNPLEYKPEEIEFIPDTPAINEIDWEQRKFELVKAAMQGLLSNPYWMGLKKGMANKSTKSPRERASLLQKDIAEEAVEFADAVLAEYRKGGEE